MEVLTAAGGRSSALQLDKHCPTACQTTLGHVLVDIRYDISLAVVALTERRCFLCARCVGCAGMQPKVYSGIRLYSLQIPALTSYDPAREDPHLFQIQHGGTDR